jgi:hypothetical protein
MGKGEAMKSEIELARERRERFARMAFGSENSRHLYQYYKEQLGSSQVASLERLRELRRAAGGGAAA